MRQYQKYMMALLILLGIAIGYFTFKNQENFIKRIDIVLLNMLNKQLKEEKTQAFGFAMALAQNESLQNALENNDSNYTYEIIKRYMETLELFIGMSIHTQIVTKEYKIFARSWDNSDAGLDIKSFRPDLVELAQTKKPKLSIEAARRLVLIATIPILKKGELLGFVEVIHRFKKTKSFFANYDIDFMMLLHKRYANQSVLLQQNPHIADMILATNDISSDLLATLTPKGINLLKSKGLYETHSHIFFSKPILSAKGEDLGLYVLVMGKEKLKLFGAFESELESIFTYARKDLYYSFFDEDPYVKMYHDFNDSELLELIKVATPEERKALEARLREKFRNYSKDELISLLLNANSSKKTRGIIR